MKDISKMNELYPISIAIDIKWGDMDALGHVNNTHFFRFFESARIEHMTKLDMMMSEGQTHGPILAETSCKFIRPIYFPDRIICKSRISKIGNSSMVMEHEIENGRGEVVARGQGVVVMIDFSTHQKVSISEETRVRILKMQAELLPS